MDKIENYINNVISKYDKLPPLLSALLYLAGALLGICIGASLGDLFQVRFCYIFNIICIILIPIILITFCLSLWRIADAFRERLRRIFHRVILLLMILYTLAYLIMLPGIARL